MLPICYSNSAPRLQALPGHVPKTVVVPGSGLQVLTDDDVTTVVESARFCVGFVAAHLPVQVVASDVKASLPEVVSLLAVRNVGGEQAAPTWAHLTSLHAFTRAARNLGQDMTVWKWL